MRGRSRVARQLTSGRDHVPFAAVRTEQLQPNRPRDRLVGADLCLRRGGSGQVQQFSQPLRAEVVEDRVLAGYFDAHPLQVLLHAEHHHRGAEGGEDLVVEEVLDAKARELLVACDRLLPARKALQAGHARALAQQPVQGDQEGQVGLGVREDRHVPVEQRPHFAVGTEHGVGQPGIPPAEAHARRGVAVGSQPAQGRVEHRLVLLAGPVEEGLPVVELGIQRGAPLGRNAEKGQAQLLPVELVYLGHGLERSPPHAGAHLGRGFAADAEGVVGRKLRRHAPFDPAHQVEGRLEHALVLLHPVDLGHGDRRIAKALHHPELPLELEVGIDGIRLAHAAKQHRRDLLASGLAPAEREGNAHVAEARPGAIHVRDAEVLGLGHLSPQPGGELLRQIREVYVLREHAPLSSPGSRTWDTCPPPSARSFHNRRRRRSGTPNRSRSSPRSHSSPRGR